MPFTHVIGDAKLKDNFFLQLNKRNPIFLMEALMKKAMISLSLVCLFFPWLWGAPPEPGKSVEKPKSAATAAVTDDATITKTIQEKFAASSSLKDVPVQVVTKNGVVTLTGQVKNPGAKGSATRMAKGVPGVKEVDNQMTVAGGTSSAKSGEPKTK
jgi:hypothetical protein